MYELPNLLPRLLQPLHDFSSIFLVGLNDKMVVMRLGLVLSVCV